MIINYEYDLHTNHQLSLNKNVFLNKGLTGLVNLGNKCFLNSILQCLSNTLPLTDYLLSHKFKDDDFDGLNKHKKEYYILLSYLNLIINIWDTNQVLKPKSFVENISKFVNKYYTLQQQDSHECLIYILDLLHESLSYKIEVDIKGEIQNDNDKLMKKSLDQWKKFYENKYSFVNETFNGMFYNKISCINKKCNFSENIFEPFNSISLNIPNSGSSSLNECLNNYFDNDEIIKTWSCESCKKNGCSKTIQAWDLPNYLIIHFKRFTNSGEKINTHIDFSIDDLNLTEWISDNKQDPNNYIYSLYAINYHSGNTQSGHYWSICKNLNNNWYIYDDANITKCKNTDNLLTKDSYILFYYRKYIS